MRIRNYVLANRLQPADVIVVEKNGWRVLDHYVVFLGEQHGQLYFAVNLINQGVVVVSEHELTSYSERFAPIEVRHFAGNVFQRQQAVQRAVAMRGKSYNLLSYNCEHYANYVQTGKASGTQVSNFTGLASIVLLLGILLNGKAA